MGQAEFVIRSHELNKSIMQTQFWENVQLWMKKDISI